MLDPQIEIGPFSIHFYGLIIALSVLFGWKIAKDKSKKYKIPKTFFEDIYLLIPLALAIIFARIYHVLDYFSYYYDNPSKIILIQEGGLGIWGAIFGFFFGLFLISKLKKINFFILADVSSPSFLLAQSIGRIGNYFNQEGFGGPTNKPWGIYINESNRPVESAQFAYYHPTFFYESILNLIFFVVLVYYSKRKRKAGSIFALYLIFYSAIRFAVEFYRIDTWEAGGIKIAHIIALCIFSFGLYIYKKSQRGIDTT